MAMSFRRYQCHSEAKRGIQVSAGIGKNQIPRIARDESDFMG